MRILYAISLIIFSLSTIQGQRALNLGITSGVTQFFPSESTSGNNSLLAAANNPMLSDPFRYISVNAQLGITPATAVTLDVGYSKMLGGFTLQHPDAMIGLGYYPVLAQSIFVEPGIAYSFALDKYLYVVSSLGTAVHVNTTPKERASERYQSYDRKIRTYFSLEEKASPAFVTLNPSVELRALTTPGLRFGILFKYMQGLGNVARYGGNFTVEDQDGSENFSASYDGSGILLALRLSYCLPCGN